MSDVRDFGAVGDGKTDDTAAIEHAVNFVGAAVERLGDLRLAQAVRDAGEQLEDDEPLVGGRGAGLR